MVDRRTHRAWDTRDSAQGQEAIVETPFGTKRIPRVESTAARPLLGFIEGFIREELLPLDALTVPGTAATFFRYEGASRAHATFRLTTLDPRIASENASGSPSLPYAELRARPLHLELSTLGDVHRRIHQPRPRLVVVGSERTIWNGYLDARFELLAALACPAADIDALILGDNVDTYLFYVDHYAEGDESEGRRPDRHGLIVCETDPAALVLSDLHKRLLRRASRRWFHGFASLDARLVRGTLVLARRATEAAHELDELDELEPARRRSESGSIPCARALPFLAERAADSRLAQDRGIRYLEGLDLLERRSADGLRIGIQTMLASDRHGANAIDLGELADDLASLPVSGEADAFGSDLLQTWRAIACGIERRLGFLLEPEMFSNMLFCAQISAIDDPRIQQIAHGLLRMFRHSDAAGLYHFFTSMRFACDIDCTAVALRARLVMGDIDLKTVDGAFALKKSTERILRSAAAGNVRPDTNRSHGKENGELRRYVFKVYLDDHEVQGAEYDRGLKNDAVVVLNALHSVLEELRHGLRSPEEIVPLKEYMEKRQEPRIGAANVAELVAANLAYVTQHLFTEAWQAGTRYYPSPDVFIFCFADLLTKFPELSVAFPWLELRLREALHERTSTADRGSLEVALTAIASQMLGMNASRDLEILIARQQESGCWDDFCPLFRLGSRSPQIFFGSVAQNTAFAVRALSGREAVRDTEVARPLDAAWLRPIADRWLPALEED